MDVKTKKIIGADGTVEAIAVPAEVWREITQKLNIQEFEDIPDIIQANIQDSYAYIRSKVTVPPEVLIGRKKLSIDPEYLSGTACFYESPRVPVSTLFDYVEEGYPVEEYLEDFPSIAKSTANYWLNIRR